MAVVVIAAISIVNINPMIHAVHAGVPDGGPMQQQAKGLQPPALDDVIVMTTMCHQGGVTLPSVCPRG